METKLGSVGWVEKEMENHKINNCQCECAYGHWVMQNVLPDMELIGFLVSTTWEYTILRHPR